VRDLLREHEAVDELSVVDRAADLLRDAYVAEVDVRRRLGVDDAQHRVIDHTWVGNDGSFEFHRIPAGVYELRLVNESGEVLARQAADEFSRFVAGSMGPTTKAISVTGGVTFPQLVENFYEQAQALVAGGADILLVETCQDTRNVKAALWGSNGCAASWAGEL